MLPPLGWSVWLSRKRFRALATESFWNSKVQLIIQVLLMDFVPQCPSQIRWPALRTCICKRIGALNTGLARFEGASKLTSIQNLTFVFLLVNSFSATSSRYIYIYFFLFIQQCFLYIFDLQVFLPRMQDKIKSEINHLQQSHDAIEKAYNCGIIDGFSKGPLS